MLYHELNLKDRLNYNINNIDDCIIRKASSIKERSKKDNMMLEKLKALHGPLPEGDWRAWNICGTTARQKCSSDYCTKVEHWFLYNSDSAEEKQQLRDLKKEGIIRDLPTGQKRFLTNKKNGTHNFHQKAQCPGCGRQIMSVAFQKHINSCQEYKELMNIEEKHQHILQRFDTADTNKIIITLLDKSISEFLGKSFRNRKEYVEKYKTQYIRMIESKLNDTDQDIENKNAKINRLENNNINLTNRIKQLENKLNNINNLISGNVEINAS
jgi:hypothetical protein